MVTSARYDENGSILATIDGQEMTVPNDMGNRHRQMIAGWEGNGGTIEPYSPPVPTLADYQSAIQSLIDQTAVSKQFNDGVSLASYKDSTVLLWAAQATAFIGWRDAVWVHVYNQMAKVQDGQIPQPTIDDLLGELPTIQWPV